MKESKALGLEKETEGIINRITNINVIMQRGIRAYLSQPEIVHRHRPSENETSDIDELLGQLTVPDENSLPSQHVDN